MKIKFYHQHNVRQYFEGYEESNEPEVVVTDRFTSIKSFPKTTKYIIHCSSGYDNLPSIPNNVKLFRASTANAEQVAEYVLAMCLNVLRKLNICDVASWERPTGTTLYNKKILIIGYGNIGTEVARLFSMFTPHIKVYDPYVESEYENVTLNNLEYDIITTHIPLNNNTKQFLNKEFFKKMPITTLFVNAAREGIVSEKAMRDWIQRGGTAVIDTFNTEPYTGDLQDTAVCTPHMGAMTKESQKAMILQPKHDFEHYTNTKNA